MRVCGSCKQEKDESEFSNHTYCKPCKSAYNKAHYEENKQTYRDTVKKTKARRREHIRDIKDVPCMDCKVKYPFYVMEFDHRSDKDFTIGRKFYLSLQTVQAEIDKCDIVCANCHRERTHQRGYGVTDNTSAPEAAESEFESQ